MPTEELSSKVALAVREAIAAFGAVVSPRFAAGVPGEPEEKLRGPLETLLSTVGPVLGLNVILGGEADIADLRVRPDFAVQVDGALAGHLEVKAPGKGVDPSQFKGHDRKQWEKLRFLPNLLYTDGNSWAIYRHGERHGQIVTLNGDVRWSGQQLVPSDGGLARILSDFLQWQPIPPRSAAELARTVAGLCRLLRDEVLEVLAAESAYPAGKLRPFTTLAADWRDLLFPNASDHLFADSYAQTVTFGFLLARAEDIDIANVVLAATNLAKHHGLLGRALQVLTDDQARAQVSTSIGVLQRVIGAVDWKVISDGQPILPGFDRPTIVKHTPWLYFYEDFLSVYDPELRTKAGAYYTPSAVVGAQVRLVEDILRIQLGKKLGFADSSVVTVDPAMGTGSYLLQVISQAAERVAEREGPGAVEGRLRTLASRLIGFEIMTGPYAVAELQVSAAFRRQNVKLPPNGLRLYLTDTLADPYIEETHLGGLYEPIARSRRAANRVKKEEQVLVGLGNPPYDRHEPKLGLGGWVRYGNPGLGQSPILRNFQASTPSRLS